MYSSNVHVSGQLIAFLLIGGPMAVLWGLSKLGEKRLIENTPRSKVRSAAMGLVELAGIAQSKAPLKAPVSGLACCWWHCRVQELRSDGKNSHWETIRETDARTLFYLRDETAGVLVDPQGAELRVLTNTTAVDSATRTLLGPVLQGWGIDDLRRFSLGGRLRIIEQVIAECAPLFVLGELIPLSGAGPDTMMIKAPVGGDFIIATESPQEFVQSLQWTISLALLGGAGAGVLGVYAAVLSRWSAFFIIGLLAIGYGLSFLIRKKGALPWRLSF